MSPARLGCCTSLCLALACAAKPPPAPPTAAPVPEPASDAQLEELLEGDYTRLGGSWDSEYGTVQLMFEDALNFRGIYPDGSLRGHVDVEGRRLLFEWADDFSVGSGQFEIIDDQTLEGRWGAGESRSNGGPWTLTR